MMMMVDDDDDDDRGEGTRGEDSSERGSFESRRSVVFWHRVLLLPFKSFFYSV
jgi:hypothetical protein